MRAKALLMVERKDVLRWPKPTRVTPAKKYSSKYCRFHREWGHDTKECYQLKDEIEWVVHQGYFKNQISKNYQDRGRHSKSLSQERRAENRTVTGQNARENAPVKGVIHTIVGGSETGYSRRARKKIERKIGAVASRQVMNISQELDITFGAQELKEKIGDDNDPMAMLLDPVNSPLVGFGENEVDSLGTIELPVSIGDEPRRKTLMVKFLVVNTPFAYNVILGRPGLNTFRAIVSTYHLRMKFPTHVGVGEVACDQLEARRCYNLSVKKEVTDRKRKFDESLITENEDRIEPIDENKEIELVQSDQSKMTKICSRLDKRLETLMVAFLRCNIDMFAWSPSDFKDIKVQYTDWLSNVVVVPKASGKWRMCTDFTDLNKACPRDSYPLPRIDQLVDVTAGYELFSMMDAYQGYHQIHMAKEDRIKTSFVTEQGIFRYNVMLFGLKNAGATYQRLVNRMFKDQNRVNNGGIR
ncbi:UNVERIFIED_CONTAM: Retrovirus-related Pol polyprotein from transposon opus [Sesamum indicum]